jgi:hypothetical protein
MKQSLRRSFVLELERREIRRSGWKGLWDSLGTLWWTWDMEGGQGMDVVGRDSVMLAVCWDVWEGGIRARLIDQV